MKKNYKLLIFLIGALLSQNTQAQSVAQTFEFIKKQQIRSKSMRQLMEYMTGEFNSKIQSENDNNYFNVTLHVVPIWQNKLNENWLYIEQAIEIEKPYRQRVYHLVQLNDTTFLSEIYTLPNEKMYAGAWRDPNPLSRLNKSDLIQKNGCEVLLILYKEDHKYIGKTKERLCNSKLKGATYATTNVTIAETFMLSWDRGFNNEGIQVWGATKGAYQFIKQDWQSIDLYGKKGLTW